MIIAFEGTDKMGKETQSKMLAERIKFNHKSYPTDGPCGREVVRRMTIPLDPEINRELAGGDIDSEKIARMYLFAADFTTNPPAGNVVCDRYIDSFRIHAIAHEVGLGICGMLDGVMEEPDLVFLLEGHPEKILKERTRGTWKTHELDIEFQRRIFKAYSESSYMKRNNVIRINADRDRDVIHREIMEKYHEFDKSGGAPKLSLYSN